jgi:DNA-binding CsgD family transcriptional regulator
MAADPRTIAESLVLFTRSLLVTTSADEVLSSLEILLQRLGTSEHAVVMRPLAEPGFQRRTSCEPPAEEAADWITIASLGPDDGGSPEVELVLTFVCGPAGDYAALRPHIDALIATALSRAVLLDRQHSQQRVGHLLSGASRLSGLNTVPQTSISINHAERPPRGDRRCKTGVSDATDPPRAWNMQALAGRLTAREHDVLDLIVEGRTNREIGARLSISRDTVKTHCRHIFAKLGVTRRAEFLSFFRDDLRRLTRPAPDARQRSTWT